NYGHAFYDDAQEDETFDVSIIGSNTKQTYNQLQISDMIEARLEEIYAFAEREIRKMGYHELPGGYVLTGGTMKMPSVIEHAQDLDRSNVRIAISKYIDVREPQSIEVVCIFQVDYHNTKIQGIYIFRSIIVHTQEQIPKRTKKQSTSEETKGNKKKE